MLTVHITQLPLACREEDSFDYCLYTRDDPYAMVITDGGVRKVLRGHTSYSSVSARDKNFIATTGQDRTLRIWDYKTCKCLIVIPVDHSHPSRIAWSANGRYMALQWARDDVIDVWDMASRRLMYKLSIDCPWWYISGFSECENLLVLSGNASRDVIQLCDAKSGKYLLRVSLPKDAELFYYPDRIAVVEDRLEIDAKYYKSQRIEIRGLPVTYRYDYETNSITAKLFGNDTSPGADTILRFNLLTTYLPPELVAMCL